MTVPTQVEWLLTGSSPRCRARTDEESSGEPLHPNSVAGGCGRPTSERMEPYRQPMSPPSATAELVDARWDETDGVPYGLAVAEILDPQAGRGAA